MFPIYPNTFPLKRDHQYEQDAIQCSRVELEIRNHTGGAGVRAYMKAAFSTDGDLVLFNHQAKASLRCPHSHLPMPDMSWPFPVQRECQPLVELYHDIYPAVINDDPRLSAMFFMLRLAQIDRRLSTPLPLAGLVSSWDTMDRITGRELGQHLGITGSWNADAPATGPWMLAPPFPVCADNYLNVLDANGNFRHTLRIFYDDAGHYAVLPLSVHQHPDYPGGPLVLFIPPRPPYTLINSQLLDAYPFATVILTDDIQAVLTSELTPESIVLGNPGGDAWIENLDVQPLQGRKVICHAVMEEYTAAAEQKEAQSLMLMASKLTSWGITPEFLPPQPGFLEVPYSSSSLALL